RPQPRAGGGAERPAHPGGGGSEDEQPRKLLKRGADALEGQAGDEPGGRAEGERNQALAERPLLRTPVAEQALRATLDRPAARRHKGTVISSLIGPWAGPKARGSMPPLARRGNRFESTRGRGGGISRRSSRGSRRARTRGPRARRTGGSVGGSRRRKPMASRAASRTS